jgi:3-hydroxyisobutyrate dehydrogenase-like beta-hydroxyacid dehydrogenase
MYSVGVSTVQKVGFAGVGIMGSAMSAHLIDRGYQVMGFDPSSARLDALRERGGFPADSLGQLVAASDVVITSLPTVAAAEAVLSEIGSVGRPDLTVIETSTLPLSLKARHREALLEVGVQLLDCPLSGTGAQALTRDVVVYGSGDAGAFEAARPVMDGFSRSVRFLGEFGNGTVMKFVANLLVSINNAATAEAFALGLRAGLDPAQLYETIRDGAGNSVIFEKRGRLMVEKNYLPATAKVSMFVKDIELIGSLADELNLPTPVLDSTKHLYQRAVALGLDEHDAAVLLEVIGTEPTSPSPDGAVPAVVAHAGSNAEQGQ